MSTGETTYETERLRLEPLRVGHAAEMFELLSDDRLYRFVPRDPPASRTALAARFERLEVRRSMGGEEAWLNWVLRSRANGRCMGRVEVTVRRDGTALFAYELGVEFWGQGFAAEACRRVLEALFEELGVARVIAEVDTRNAASIRLLGRLGFRRTELRTEADFFKGASSDEFMYELVQGAGNTTR
ncbi:MAG TPA: GNAT family protein [Candidatus Nanopelagicales bacterium]|nr:GNAT family protein [Candidatus Nanopelagicales bacterium]